MAPPQFWIVAGPNGAGKTTCVQKKPISELLPNVRFHNPDDRTLAKLQTFGYRGFADAPIDVQTRFFFESADEVFADLQRAIAQGESVGVETVLSSPKYEPLVESVVSAQGTIGLIYIALASPEIARSRVAARVRRGGHGIPDDKIDQRWRRSLERLPWFARRATAFWIIDNSDSNPDSIPLLLASGQLGKVEFLHPNAFGELKSALAEIPSEND